MKISHLLLACCLLSASITYADTVFQNEREDSTIIELFTSQGCSSCPPAESWLGKFKDDPRLWKTLFPLAFHVDYWDYIGWKDIYASPVFSKRQKQYRTENRLSSVYTPGFVVNGREWRGWFSRKALPDGKIGGKTAGQLTASLDNGQLTAEYLVDGLQAYGLTLNAAIVGTGITTEVKRGENAGRSLPQDFTVLQFHTARSATKKWQMELPGINANDAERLALVIWVSSADSLQPLQVAGGWL